MEHAKHTPIDDEPECLLDLVHAPSVRVEPEWSAWDSALGSTRESGARASLGLDTDRPIVMSGHQPILFHNGILAKLIALDEAAKRGDAQAVWIVPDQDALDPGAVRVPMGRRETLGVELVELLDLKGIQNGSALCSIPAIGIHEPAHASLKPIVEWLDQYAGLESIAQQFGYATIEHACELLGIESPRILFASELFAVDELYELVQLMHQDPKFCAQSYNHAAKRFPEAGVRALVIEDDRIELPLWGCRAGEARVAIDTKNIEEFAREELVPRGLLMSAMARAYLADLFIHGLGGYIYDQISEAWFKEWVEIDLQPMAMVSATQHLDLGFSSDEVVDIVQSKWDVHHARHTPTMVGDQRTQQRKDELVSQIELLKPKDAQRETLYRALQTLLSEYRDTHSAEIEAFGERSDQAMALARQFELARDRTWSFVFFDQDALRTLDRATRRAMG